MNLYNTKGVLGSWKLWFSYIHEKKIKKIKKMEISARFGRFSFSSWREKGHKPSRARAELKILQLELWLKPAWLGLITSEIVYFGTSWPLLAIFKDFCLWKQNFSSDFFPPDEIIPPYRNISIFCVAKPLNESILEMTPHWIPFHLKYGFWKNSIRKNATLNSWTLSSSKKGACSN